MHENEQTDKSQQAVGINFRGQSQVPELILQCFYRTEKIFCPNDEARIEAGKEGGRVNFHTAWKVQNYNRLTIVIEPDPIVL